MNNAGTNYNKRVKREELNKKIEIKYKNIVPNPYDWP